MRHVFLPLVAALLILIAAGVLLNRLPVAPEEAGPGDLHLSCPVRVVVGTDADGKVESRNRKWEISRTIAGGREPDIRAGASTDVTTPEGGDTCLLDIRKPPTAPFEGIDWRIGHSLFEATDLRGKMVTARMFLRADRPITFEAASFYGYDGFGVGAVAIQSLGTEWQEFSFAKPINTEAQVLELWLRLTIHGAISTGGKIYFGGAELVAEPG